MRSIEIRALRKLVENIIFYFTRQGRLIVNSFFDTLISYCRNLAKEKIFNYLIDKCRIFLLRFDRILEYLEIMYYQHILKRQENNNFMHFHAFKRKIIKDTILCNKTFKSKYVNILIFILHL